MPKSAKETHSSRMALWEASMHYHDSFVDPNTGLFDEKYLEQRCCPVCGTEHEQKLFIKASGSYVKCNDCTMVYLNPVFTDDALVEFYSNNHTSQSATVESDMTFYRTIYGTGLGLIDEHLKQKQRILDFGCSSGIFLDLALEQGWKETHGVELNKKEAEIARSKHHNVQSCVLSELNFEDKFDAITLWDVFEHIKDGKAYLESFKNYLAPDGVLFLQVPNAGSLAARILHDKCNMFDGLEHVNLYSPKTIKLLVEQAGYNVVAMKSVIPETNVIANYLSFDDPYLGNQPATDGFLEMISNDEILDKLLGYKIQVALKAI